MTDPADAIEDRSQPMEMSAGRRFAEMLDQYRVTHVFLVPAVFNSAMVVLEELGIARIATHHESAAAMMADGYARASRRPGVCLSQAVGGANMAAGIRDAFQAGSPVIGVTGGPDPDNRYRYKYQIVDDFTMFGPVTKVNLVVERADRLPDLLRHAIRVATTGNPGPAHLELPGRLGEGVDGPVASEPARRLAPAYYPAHRPGADPDGIETAVTLLSRAQRPLIVAGGGVIASGAANEVMRLARATDTPVAVTLAGKGAVVDDDPLAVGLIGGYGQASANRIALEADVILFIGCKGSSLTTGDRKIPSTGSAAIQIDIDPTQLGRNLSAEIGLLGDARTVLRQLIDAFAALVSRPGRTAWVERVHAARNEWVATVAAQRESDASPLRPERLAADVSAWLPSDAIVVVDTGHAAIWAGAHLAMTSPEQRFIPCAGTLGWALPASIGVKLALPDRPVVCFTGDGGLAYHLAELETAVRANANVIIVVVNNSAYQQVRPGIAATYGGAPTARSSELWAFRPVDYSAIAESFGCLGLRVERPIDLRPALDRALAANRPTIIDVVTDVDAYPSPSWS